MKKFLSIILAVILTCLMLFGQSAPINPASLRYYIENIHFTKFRADSLTIDDFATFGDSVFVDSLVANYLTVNDSAYIDTLTIGTKIIPDANDGALLGTDALNFAEVNARQGDFDSTYVGVLGENIDANQKVISDLGTLQTDSVISNSGNLQLSGAGTGIVEVTDSLSVAGTISSTGQYTNTVAGGTAPMVITSTTKTTNLNVDLLDDKSEAEFATLAEAETVSGKYTFSDTLIAMLAVKGGDGVIMSNETSLKSGLPNEKSWLYPYDDGSTVHIMATKDDNATETQVKLAEQSSITNLSAKGAGYFFNGSSYIQLPSSPMNGNGSDYSVIIKLKTPQTLVSYAGLYDLGASSDGVAGCYVRISSTGAIGAVVGNGTTRNTASFSTLLSSNTNYSVGIVISLGNSKKLYVDNILKESISLSAITGNLSNSSTPYIFTGRYLASEHYRGSGYEQLHFNLALTAAEIAEISEKGVPYKYKDASQTQVGGNVNDAMTADNTGNWTGGNGTLAFDTDHYELTSTAGGTTTMKVAGSGLVIGYNYTWKVRIKDGTDASKAVSLIVKNNAESSTIATGTAVTTSASDQWVEVSWVATETNNMLILSVAGMTTAANIEIGDGTYGSENRHTGCVAEYLPEGIGHYSWLDNSGNALHGTVSGALPFGLNIGDTRVAYLSTTSTSPTMTDVQRGGWRVKSIVMETAQNLTEIDVTQETSAIELMSDKTLNNGKMVWSTLADHNVYAVGTDKDLVFKLTGNGGDGTKIYVTLEKVF